MPEKTEPQIADANVNDQAETETPLPDDGGSFSHTLIRPIPQADGSAISKLVFEEPSVNNMIDAEQRVSGANALTAATLARCAGITLEDFGKIKARDYNAILGKAGPWLGNG